MDMEELYKNKKGKCYSYSGRKTSTSERVETETIGLWEDGSGNWE